MLTDIRWEKEQELMRSVFPEFTPFINGRRFGFEGRIKGGKSGNLYHITMQADRTTYPQIPPNVLMKPRIGMYWIGAGDRRMLCMQREWRPARSTFANTLLAVIRYVDEFDPRPGSEEDSEDQLPDSELDLFPATAIRRRFY